MKRKYADYPNWEIVLEKEYKNRYFRNSDFEGNISLLTAVKVKKKVVIEDKLIIIDNGFKWLEIYPEHNKNIAVSVSTNNKGEILKWYFDIAKDSGLTEQGIPYIEDLYIDIILTPDGKIRIIDKEELQQALEKGIVTQDINEAHGVGQIKVSGEVWSAKTTDGSTIEKGTQIEIIDIDGVKAVVEPTSIVSEVLTK